MTEPRNIDAVGEALELPRPSTRDERIAQLEADLAIRTQALTLTDGAIRAQDAREQAAGVRCGVPRALYGCDWPDAVAEALVARTQDLKQAQADVMKATHIAFVAMKDEKARTQERDSLAEAMIEHRMVEEQAITRARLTEAALRQLTQERDDARQALRDWFANDSTATDCPRCARLLQQGAQLQVLVDEMRQAAVRYQANGDDEGELYDSLRRWADLLALGSPQSGGAPTTDAEP